jgi:hypothetical protein
VKILLPSLSRKPKHNAPDSIDDAVHRLFGTGALSCEGERREERTAAT